MKWQQQLQDTMQNNLLIDQIALFAKKCLLQMEIVLSMINI